MVSIQKIKNLWLSQLLLMKVLQIMRLRMHDRVSMSVGICIKALIYHFYSHE